jgi:HEPN domain-containing protein
MDIDAQIAYWVNSAKHDFDTIKSLMKEEKYDWALFLCHLVIEKLLKVLYIKQKMKYPPRTHNLIFLTKEINVDFDEKTIDFLEELNAFHISSRYPDNQLEFYKICTKDFSENKFKATGDAFQWLLGKMKY